jgi:hypothetical protein
MCRHGLATRHNSHLLGLHVYASVPAPPVPMTGANAGERSRSSEAIVARQLGKPYTSRALSSRSMLVVA